MRTPARVFVDARRTPSRRYRVLIVDDEPDIVETLSRVLRKRFEAEVEVVGAPDGLAALDRLRQGGIDVILTDFRMPQMNGLDLLERTKTIAPLAVRIMMTAYPDVDLAVRAINDESVIRFLVKPIDRQKILETIQAALDGIRAREARDKLIADSAPGGRVG